MKKIIFCASAILLALSVLAGCAPRETPDGSPQNTKSASQTQSNSSTEQAQPEPSPSGEQPFGELVLPNIEIPDSFESKNEEIEFMFKYYMQAVPSITWLPDYDPVGYPGIKALYYDGLKNNGVQTKIFAYIGFPEGASAENPVPAVVLLHGGGGFAFPQWVKVWNDRGYAAIAMCNTGYRPKNGSITSFYDSNDWIKSIPAEERKEDSRILIPDNDGMSSYNRDVSRQWMYHAVGSAIMANNLLRADERIDSDKIGLTGISWGGVIASIAMGYDNRYAFNIPIYGHAHLGESLTWMKNHFTPGAVELWDASKRLDKVTSPILWLCWAGDNAFSINTNSASYMDTISKSVFSMRMNMGHSHDLGWIPYESYRFADWAVKGGLPMTSIKEHPSSSAGRDVDLSVEIPSDTTALSAICYYIDAPLSYGADSNMEQEWQKCECEVDIQSGKINARLPEEAKGYYVEITSVCPQGSYVTSSEFITLE